MKGKKKIHYTFRPNQNTKRCFWYYESNKRLPKAEDEIIKVIKDRGYNISHTNIIKFKPKVRGQDYIEV